MREISVNEINTLNTTICFAFGKFFGKPIETDYASKKNEIGYSAYPLGFGTCKFLPKETRFFEGTSTTSVESLKEFALKVMGK